MVEDEDETALELLLEALLLELVVSWAKTAPIEARRTIEVSPNFMFVVEGVRKKLKERKESRVQSNENR
jgi:hypothetical protein